MNNNTYSRDGNGTIRNSSAVAKPTVSSLHGLADVGLHPDMSCPITIEQVLVLSLSRRRSPTHTRMI